MSNSIDPAPVPAAPDRDEGTVALLRQVTVNGKRDGARLWLWASSVTMARTRPEGMVPDA